MAAHWIWAVLLLAAEAAVGQEPRAINSTGLWSKYNLVVRPAEGKGTTSPAPPASPRWEEEEYGQDLSLEHQDVEEEDSEEAEEEEEEDEQVYIPHTTQRSKGDSAKRKRRPSVHKTKLHTRKGYKGHKGHKGLKKLKKYMFPLLIAYKLKFFTLIPLLLGGLVLIVATTGFAGFFFALFAVGVGLKKD